MKEAVVAIEDQRFYEHDGVDFQGIAPRRLAGRHLRLGPAGRLDDHPAVRQERARRAGQPDRVPEAARGRARLPPRAPVVEGQDPHRVPERDLLRRGRDGIEAAAQHLLRLQPPRLRRGRRRPTVRLAAPALGGGDARRDHLLAERVLDPETSPRTRPRAATRCSQNMRDAGLHHRRGVHRSTAPGRSRPRSRSQPPAENSDRPLLHLLAAPAAGRPLRRRRGVRRRAADQVDARPRAPEAASRRSSSRRSPGSRRPPRPSSSTTRPAACWRWSAAPTTRRQPVQPRDQRPPPAGLVVQAVHAGDRARAGALDRRGLHLGAAGDPVPDQGGEEERQGRQGRPRPVPGQQLRRQLPRLRLDRHAPRPTPTTPSTHSSAPRSASRTSPRPRTRWGSRPTSLDQGLRVLDRGRAVAAVQPGADPRWARDRRHPARDGARLQHARGRRQAALGHDGTRTPAARSGSSTSPTAATASATRTATRCPTRPAPAASTSWSRSR